MIKIVAVQYIHAEHRATFLNLAKELIKKSNEEAGCIFYQLFEDVKTPNTFVFLEDWKSQKAIDEHNKSAHFIQIVPQFTPLQKEPAHVTVYKDIPEL